MDDKGDFALGCASLSAPTTARQYILRHLSALAIPTLASCMLLWDSAAAQHPIIAKGDAVVTGFSGTITSLCARPS